MSDGSQPEPRFGLRPALGGELGDGRPAAGAGAATAEAWVEEV